MREGERGRERLSATGSNCRRAGQVDRGGAFVGDPGSGGLRRTQKDSEVLRRAQKGSEGLRRTPKDSDRLRRTSSAESLLAASPMALVARISWATASIAVGRSPPILPLSSSRSYESDGGEGCAVNQTEGRAAL